MADKNTIKNWFRTNLKPTQEQFWATWDSYFHKDEKIPITAIDDIEAILADKADAEALTNHKNDAVAHAELFLGKEDKTEKGAINGYAPLNEVAKIASQYLSIVNDLITGGANDLLAAEQGKLLQIQITAINTLLTSDNVNLDNVQEIVDAIENVQTSLSTILVNDLTTGGTTKALTAEMGKTLKVLIDGLTTNKVDKVAGERLINAAEITKLAGLGSLSTTVKPILSTALATQNVAGFVTYINALNPVLVVGASEIVKYNLTDTGRVFELNLRGRSFGDGQPAIVAANVLEVTDFLNKDIRFSNYPSTRNDGQLPTNKVLAPDANGNVKLYSIAIAPAPWIKELIPDSYYPDTTGNIRILGDFFTPEMCNRLMNPNAIIIGGVATIHYANFISSQEILVNVTTGSVEGSFSITLNNGLQTVKSNSLSIVLGVVFTPLTSEWTLTEPIEVDNDKVSVQAYGTFGIAEWNKIFPYDRNWSFRCEMPLTPLGGPPGDGVNPSSGVRLIKVSNNSVVYGISKQTETIARIFEVVDGSFAFCNLNGVLEIKYRNGVITFLENSALKYTSVIPLNENLKLSIRISAINVKNIKYIELL